MQLPKVRILCVEDHADTCAMYRVVLGLEGYAFDSAESAAEAMALIETHHYDLFLLDHGLAGEETGVDLCQWIRERKAEVPIILASAQAFPKERSEALTAGANAYLVKPINPPQLVNTVAELLAERQ